MRPVALDVQTTGDLGGEKIAMRFDEDSIEFLMSVMTDLYSDPELAVIREISTNAYDSHVEAGQTRPIEVTTPSSLSPYFKVKDYGIGMSCDDVRKVYSAYGASTKRESDNVVGMLGLGSKSPWTYTAQFSVIAVKDGQKTTVSANRTETGRTMLEIVDTCATDEPNSVEIVVPAKQQNSFDYKAKQFFRFWQPGRVLLNGQEPTLITGDSVGDRMVIVSGLDRDYVVMGNVAYPTNERIWPDANYNWGVVTTVEIGDVAFVPSREALNYNSHTKATIVSLRDEFQRLVAKTIEDDVKSCATHSDALNKWLVWVDRFGPIAREVKYKGEEFKTSWKCFYKGWSPHKSRNTLDNSRYEKYMDFNALQNGLCITNFDFDAVSTYQRQKIRLWAESKGMFLPNKVYFFTAEIPGAPWTDHLETVDWDVIKAFRIPKGATAHKASGGLRFEVAKGDGGYDETDTLDDSLPILYFSKADHNEWNVSKSLTLFIENDGIQVVSLTKNRWDKFLREFPNAIALRVWLNGMVKAAAAALTDDDKICLGLDGYQKSSLKQLDETRIDDPNVVRYIKLAKQEDKDSSTLNAYQLLCGVSREAVNSYISAPDVKSPLTAYPLLNLGYGTRYTEHNYCYMNSWYAYKQERKRAKAEAALETGLVQNAYPNTLDEETAA